jgi:hypothetical protein
MRITGIETTVVHQPIRHAGDWDALERYRAAGRPGLIKAKRCQVTLRAPGGGTQ